jgi:hypothetical protein
MAEQALYFGIRNLALNNTQRNTLRDQILALGARQASLYPNERMQMRVRNDNQAIIFEAVFETDNLTATAIRNRLAAIFGVAQNTITPTTTTMQLAGRTTTVITFTRNSTDYLQAVAFGYNGGGWPAWELSRQAVAAYIAANAVEWETAL